MRRLQLLLIAALVLALAASSQAQAGTYSTGTGEPAFTNTTTNTHWFAFAGNGFDGFRLDVNYFVGPGGGIFRTETTGNLGNPAMTVGWADWSGVVEPLVEGVTYGVCVSGDDYYNYLGSWVPQLGGSSCADAILAGKRTNTTIDRTKPVIQVAVSGSDTYTRTVPIPVTIGYSDNLAFPFPANFVCARTGVEPSAAAAQCNAAGPPQYNYSADCSVPLNPSSNVTQFNCSVTDSPPLADGPVTVCAVSADAAIPDNPSSSNQAQTADKANLSVAQCGYVILDRTAPQLSFGAPESVKVGELVSVTGSVSDAGSGAGPSIGWTWGDNTAGSSGISPTHTYTQPGTYTITMSSADAAGNPGSTTRTITVTAPATGGGTTGGGTTGGGSSTGGGSVTTAPTAQEIARQVGATGGTTSATQRASAGALDVLTARKVKITSKLKSLPLALTADTAGAAQFALVRGGRIAAKSGLNVTKPGSLGFKLKLPKRLKAGRYSLKITFTPTGATRASTKTIAITFSSAKKKPASKARTAVTGRVGSHHLGNVPPAALPDGRPATAPPGGGISIPRR